MVDKKEKQAIEVEDTTVEKAIKKALTMIREKRERVKITILNEGKNGLFGMKGPSQAKIRVTGQFNIPNIPNISKQNKILQKKQVLSTHVDNM